MSQFELRSGSNDVGIVLSLVVMMSQFELKSGSDDVGIEFAPLATLSQLFVTNVILVYRLFDLALQLEMESLYMKL